MGISKCIEASLKDKSLRIKSPKPFFGQISERQPPNLGNQEEVDLHDNSYNLFFTEKIL